MSLMLDSGAFSAWTRQVPICLDEYISFCKAHPKVDYYVNLDVIPGSPTEQATHTEHLIEGAAEQGWKNFCKMIRYLPIEKVIPVYHYQESLKWLDKILDSGAPYIGIGFGRAKTTRLRASWLKQIRKHLTGQDGRCIRAVHGFAVTGFDLMKCFPWHSVDSASWVIAGGLGRVFIPRYVGGRFDYSEDPTIFSVSDTSPDRGDRTGHALSTSPLVRGRIDAYLESCGVPYGTSDEIDVPSDYKLQIGRERWIEKGRRIVRIVKSGVVSDHRCRKLVNAIFFRRVNEALPIERIYLAGAGVPARVEKAIANRLLSYADIPNRGSEGLAAFGWHCENTEKESMQCG
jgi:hypothetical protein